jgi:hypothetical protein
LLAHVTNDHVRLPPVFGALAREVTTPSRTKLIAITRRDDGRETDERTAGKVPSEWVLLTDTRAELDLILRSSKDWQPLVAPASQSVWTDDYANVLGALRF